jgi:solute:Na+ symporter, SSS family
MVAIGWATHWPWEQPSTAYSHEGEPHPSQGFSGFAAAVMSGGGLDPPSARAADPTIETRRWLNWQPLPAVPDAIGVAGPFAGSHKGAAILAGGANFSAADAANLWDVEKKFHAAAYVLVPQAGEAGAYAWRTGFKLDRPVAYGASASTPAGVVCAGGEDGKTALADAFLIRWDTATDQLRSTPLPPLPATSTSGGGALVGNHVYVVAGQEGLGLETATDRVWRLDISRLDGLNVAASKLNEAALAWEALPPVPGGPRAFPLVAAQHNGFDECLYVIGGRRQEPGTVGIGGIDVLADCLEFSPTRFAANPATGWRKRAAPPTPLMAGAAAALGQSHVVVLTAADGTLLEKIAADPDFAQRHPGFPRRALAYHTITDTWTSAGQTPAAPVTTPAVAFDGGILLISGEIRPRVRTSEVWRITAVPDGTTFGGIDYAVLVAYLLGMVGVGVYFMNRMKDTDDFFRGGQQMAWWAAGCSIFATMLSSITFMSIPAKAFAQDWVYALGNLLILAVAPVAVYLALPFFRRIDATSAYEYLELRFNRAVRLFASGLFTLFHTFRMAIVMSLAGLALAVVTPLSPSQSVILMGLLSILYCTLGGVEAVIWTDTIQTAVLLGGAMLCLVLMVLGSDGGLTGAVATAAAGGKLHAWNLHLDPTSANLALWVVILGGLGQNFSSYTSDQAVVQRYMTTPDERRAATSIWLAAGLAVVATLLFFSLGSGLYAFYRAHPEKLDPTFTTDQIFPLFILHETFPGVAGLIVAGIFAAAQSTVSTSMNSTATTLVTDFLRPCGACRSEAGYLRMARGLTIFFGLLGTLLGLMFVDPSIRSLFDSFVKVVGIFMGVLGGLFALGMLTRTASGPGAFAGVLGGAAVMFALPFVSPINGYLYPAIGILACFVIGFLASLVLPARPRDLTGLTVIPQGHRRPAS